MKDFAEHQQSGMKDMQDLPRRDFIKLTGASALSLAGGLSVQVGKAYSEDSKKIIRMAVVGGGFGASFYWNSHPNCEVTGVTDLRPDRRLRLKNVYQCDQAYNSLEEMIEKADNIDAIAIFTEATNHVKHAKMCLEKGWHVVSAVPACMTLDEAEILKETVEKTGLTYMMAETSYYRQNTILTRQLYKENVLGEVFYSELEYYHDRGDLDNLVLNKQTRFYNLDGTRSWRWGLPPLSYPSHCLGYLTGITGERIVSVSALGWGDGKHPWLTSNDYDNPFWNEASMMQTDQGHMARCNVFFLCAAHGERANWFGDKATMYMFRNGLHDTTLNYRTGAPPQSYLDLPTQEGGTIEVPLYWKTDMLPKKMRHASMHGGSHTFLAAEFINALVEEREPAIGLYDSLAMCVPGIVGHQSALKNGEQMKVPQYDPPGKKKA